MYRFTLSSFFINKPVQLVRKRASSAPIRCKSERRILPRGSHLYRPHATILRREPRSRFLPAKERGGGGEDRKVTQNGMGVSPKRNMHAIGERVRFVPVTAEPAVLDGVGMTRIRKWRISWNAPTGQDVTAYKLYWAVGSKVNYASDFVEVGNVTEVVLPEDAPPFPLARGEMEIGVTSIGRNGNESNMTVISALFDPIAPGVPSNLKVQNL